MDFGTANFNSVNSLKVEKIQKEAASDGLAESFTESGPQVRSQAKSHFLTDGLLLIFPTDDLLLILLTYDLLLIFLMNGLLLIFRTNGLLLNFPNNAFLLIFPTDVFLLSLPSDDLHLMLTPSRSTSCGSFSARGSSGGSRESPSPSPSLAWLGGPPGRAG